jgi:hypothetical protein
VKDLRHSNLLTIVAIAVVAYAAADVAHELLGHAVVAALSGVKALSISSVAVQTDRSSRAVAAAGTIANVLIGLVVFALLARRRRFNADNYALWLFGCVGVMNCGYLIFSALFDSGDWAVVIAGWHPPWLWRLGLAIVGVIWYAVAIWLAEHTAGGWVSSGEVSKRDLGRLMIVSYIAGGMLLVLAAALNPIGFRYVAISGVGGSFGLTCGLLRIPGAVGSHSGRPATATKPLAFEPVWVTVAVVVAILFVGVLGPGVRLCS